MPSYGAVINAIKTEKAEILKEFKVKYSVSVFEQCDNENMDLKKAMEDMLIEKKAFVYAESVIDQIINKFEGKDE